MAKTCPSSTVVRGAASSDGKETHVLSALRMTCGGARKLVQKYGVQPMDVFSALDIHTPFASATSRDTQAVQDILERALDSLGAAFPGEVPA